MVQQIKVLATRSDDLSLVLKMHTIKGENLLLKIVLPPLHLWGEMRLLLHTK